MQLVSNPVVKYDTIGISVVAGTTATKLVFPDQPQLRNTNLMGFDFPRIAFDFYGNPTINLTASFLENSYVTLYFDGKENIFRMPIVELNSNSDSGFFNINGLLGFSGQTIIWTKSYVTLGLPYNFVDNRVILFGVYYV